MGEFLHRILEAIGDNQHFAYALVFLLSFSESFPVFGSLIPGTTVIVAIAALVPSGAVDIWWLLGSAIAGAIGGDGFSYWLGRRYHREIGAMWPLRKYPQVISIGEAAIRKHGGKSVFIARFTPAIRAIVPLVAGILGMNAWRFYVVNIVSAFAWAVSHIVPAVIAGASLALAGAVGGRLLVLIVVLLVFLWLILVMALYAVRKGLPLMARGVLKLWHWARHHDNWASREILSLIDPSHHEIKGLLLLVALLVAGTWALFGVLENVVSGELLVRADQAVFNFMQSVRTLWADRTMVALSELGDPLVTGAVVVAVALWLASRNAARAATYWLGAIAFAGLFVEVLKLILRLPRPIPLYSSIDVLGFPAGHVAVTATAYGFLALLVGRELAPGPRKVLAVVVTLLVSLIAFSRLYLGAHWVSDVAAGLAFAIAWVAGLGLVYLSHRPREIRVGGLIAVAVVVFVTAGTFNATGRFASDVRTYAVKQITIRMAAEKWWSGGWTLLPPRRIDLIGDLDEPITLQWAGSVESLKARLLERGWREPPRLTLESALAWLETGADLADLPVITRLHDGRPARLVLIRTEPSSGTAPRARLILRLWRAPMELEDGPERSYRLWLGSVVEQRLYHVGSFLTFGMSGRDENAPRARLEAALAPVRIVHRAALPDPWGWNGWVLLAHDPALALPAIEKGVEP